MARLSIGLWSGQRRVSPAKRLRNTVLSVEMLLHQTYCHVSLVAFSGGKCRVCLALPEVPASDLPVLIHSRWLLPGPLRHPPLPGVSLFRHFRCYLGELSLAYAPVEHLSACGTPRCDQRRFHSPRRCSDEHFLVKPSTESLCWRSRVTTRATVGREESLSGELLAAPDL